MGRDMLYAMTTRILNAPRELCIKCITNLTKFMEMSKHIHIAREYNGEYEVVLKLPILGITRYYKVKLRVKKGKDRIEYTSTEDSSHYFRMRFGLGSPRPGRTRIVVYAEMKTNLLTSLIARRNFRRFIEELVDNNLRNLLNEIASGEQVVRPRDIENIECTNCILYEHSSSICYYLRIKVENPKNPPCGGKAYVLLKSISEDKTRE